MRAAGRRAQVGWYGDLNRGRGSTEAMSAGLRSVLLEMTAAAADAQLRTLDDGRAAAARANDRHDGLAAFREFGRMVAIGFGVWILTPVVASFGTIVIPAMSTAVFVASENNGRSEGDGPMALYAHLAVVVLLFCLAMLALNLIFGVKVRFHWIVWIGGIGGLALAAVLLYQVGGAIWQWDIAPIALVISYALAQVCTTVTDLRRYGRRRAQRVVR